MHNGKTGAHLGVNKTLDKIRQRFHWVTGFTLCRQCSICAASHGPQTRSREPMKQYNVGLPFERLAIDVAGPFPQTNRGNKYILVAMDYFSKWPEMFAIPKKKPAQSLIFSSKMSSVDLVCRWSYIPGTKL